MFGEVLCLVLVLLQYFVSSLVSRGGVKRSNHRFL